MSYVQESSLRVRYVETDQMGIVHHANYLAWFEIGRTDLCRAAGTSYREIEDAGFLLVVAEVRCRYRAPFRYDDNVRILTRIEKSGSRTMVFLYELLDDSGSVRATGQTHHIWVDRNSRRPTVAPPALRDAFERLARQ